MFRISRFTAPALAFAVSIALLAGCAAAPTVPNGSGSATQPTITPSAAPATRPTTVPSTIPTTLPDTVPSMSQDDNLPFQIDVRPGQLKGFSIPGQRVVFLVTIAEAARAGGRAVEVSAAAKDAAVTVDHQSITGSQVAEVTVIPSSTSAGRSIEVTFTGIRGSATARKVFTFDVIDGMDDRKNDAVELRNRFVAWLARNRPELGLHSETRWTGTMVSPEWLVVSHYLFFSDEWEMHVQWHIMIAPDDWARIDLRHRYDQTRPSDAFEISSRSAGGEPKPIAVPEEIWR